MYTYKVMLHPNNKQMTKIRHTLNKCIECNNIVFDYLDSFIKEKKRIPDCKGVRKWFTIQKKILDDMVTIKREGLANKEIKEKNLDTFFYDVSNDALKQEIKDTYNSFIRYFKKLSDYPVKKEYKEIRKGYYVDPYKISFTYNKVRLEKIANNQKANRQALNYINLAEKGRIPVNCKYYNPRVILEGDRLYIVVSVDDNPNKEKYNVPLTDKIIGIDLNISEIVSSDDDHFLSVCKSKKYKKTNKKLKRVKRKLSKKYIHCTKLNKNKNDRRNYFKQLKIKRKYERRLNNLKKAHDIELIYTLVHKLPRVIQTEDLDIKSMQANDKKEAKQIRKGIQINGWSKLIRKLEEISSKYNIQIKKIDRWYPSSKKCHICGTIKKELKLSERIYKCNNCGLTIGRDLNAAINIKNYSTI